MVNRDHNLKYSDNGYCCIPPFCSDTMVIKCITQKKTVPLDKITDLTFSQGLLQRWCGIEQIAVQTASSGANRAEMVILGLKDAKDFRRAVMEMKDAAKKGESSLQAAIAAAQMVAQSQVPAYAPPDSTAVFKEIAASVSHIEKMLEAMEMRSRKYEKLKQVEE